MSALTNTKVDEDEAGFEAALELIETKSQDLKIKNLSDEVIHIEGTITVSF